MAPRPRIGRFNMYRKFLLGIAASLMMVTTFSGTIGILEGGVAVQGPVA